MVLIMIMAIAILSLGYVARSDIDLAAGQNTAIRLQLDQLAMSGVEHARGLILNPQDATGEYWTGDTGLQLDTGSQNYYDVTVQQDANDYCNYTLTSSAYRLDGAKRIGGSELTAALRLDPCVGLWTATAGTIPQTFSIAGDVYCVGNLFNQGTIDGDTFSTALSGTGTITGSAQDLIGWSLAWPSIDASYTHPDYSTISIGPGTVSGSNYSTPAIHYCSGDLILGDNVTIEGMLLVDGNLTIAGSSCSITAAKNLPAIYVSGDLTIDDVNALGIQGLVIVDGLVWAGAAASNVQFVGGLFANTSVYQTAPDSSGNNYDLGMYGEPTWRSTGGKDNGALEFDGADDLLADFQGGSYLNGLMAVTVSVWVKSDATGVDRGILYVRDPATTTEDRCLGLRYDQTGIFGGTTSCLKASLETGMGTSTQIESSGGNQTTNWQHLTLVWSSGESLKLYIDGSYDSPSYNAGPVTGWIANADRLLVGNGAYGNLWDGYMDEFRIYNRALDPTEIQQLYLNPGGGSTIGLLVRYKLDEEGPGVQIAANPAAAAIELPDGSPWSPAADAFFKTIER